MKTHQTHQFVSAAIVMAAAVAFFSAAGVQAAISVGISGTGVLTFNAQPTLADGWSTLSIAGAALDVGNATEMDGKVQPLTAAGINTALGSSTTWPPSANAIARWNGNTSTGYKLQTRPTGNAANVLMATFENQTGGTVSALNVSYDHGSWVADAEQIYGHCTYFSLTGLANSWQPIPAFSTFSQTVTTGETKLSASLNLGAWAPNAPLYILWADDNADGGTEGAYTIDNFSATPEGLATSWNGLSSSNWGDAANWTPNSIPDAAGTAVRLGDQVAPGSNVVDLQSTGRTVGLLSFGATSGTTVQSTGGGTLTLDNGAAASIMVAGTHVISAPLAMNSDLAIGGDGQLTISGAISGAKVLSKSGAGTLVLTSAASSYSGGTVLNAGTLRVSADGVLGAIPLFGASVTFSGSSTLQFGAAGVGLDSGRVLDIVSGKTGTIDTQAYDATINGAINGAGGMNKAGSGTLTLTGMSSYSGATSVNAGTLRVNSPGSITSAVTVQNNATLGGTGTFGGVSVASGGHLAPGSGVGTLTAASLNLASGSILDFEFDATAANDRIDVLTFDGLTIDGGGLNLYQAGTTTRFDSPGHYQLMGYSGTIGGTGGLQGLSVLNPNPALYYALAADGGKVTLDISVLALWTGGASPDANWSNPGNWTNPPVPNAPVVFRGSVTPSYNDGGSGPYASLQFNADAGPMTLNGKTVTLTGDATNSNAVVLNNSPNTQTINMPITITGAGRQINAANGNIVLGGAISGSDGLTKSGSGMATLMAANSYSGDTRIAAGILTVGHQNALQGTTLDMNKSDAGTLSFGAGVTDVFTLGGLKGSRPLNLGSVAVSIGANNEDTAYSGSLSGDKGLTKDGTGTLTLSGDNSYAGETRIKRGTLKILPAAAPVAGMLYWLDPSNPASLVTSGANVTGLNDLSGNGRSFTVNGGTAPDVAPNAFGTLTGVHFNGASFTNRLDYIGSVNAQSVFIVNRPAGNDTGLDGIWGWPGNDKSIRLRDTTGWNGNPGSGDGNDFTNSGGGTTYITTASTFDVNTTEYGGYGTAHIIAAYGNMTFTDTGLGYAAYGNRYYRGEMGEVLVYGWQLSAAERQQVENYLQAKWLGGGVGGGTAIPPTSPVRIDAAGTLDLSATFAGSTVTIGPLSGEVGSQVVLGAGKLAVNSTANSDFAGAISGPGTLVKTGAGILTLSGGNTFTGEARLQEGVLKPTNSLALQNATLSLLGTDTGTLDYSTLTTLFLGGLSGDRDLALSGIAMTVGNNDVSSAYSGALSGTVTVAKTGNGTWTLSGANTYTGSTAIYGGTLSVNTLSDAGTASALGAPTGAAAAITLVAGKLQYTGGATSSNRAITLSGDGIVENNATGGTLTLAGGISGSGYLTLQGSGDGVVDSAIALSARDSLTKTGTGTWTLTKANSYGGGTTVLGGVLSVSDDPQLGTASVGDVTIDGGTLRVTGTSFTSATHHVLLGSAGGTLDISDAANSFSISQDLGPSTGGLTKIGSGTLRLAGSHSYEGATSVNAGTLQVVGTVNTPAAAVTVAAAGTLSLSGTGALNAQTLDTAGMTVLTAGSTGTIATMNVTGGTASVGSLVVGTLNASAGTTTLGAAVTTLNVSGAGALNTDPGATVTTARLTGTGTVNTQGNYLAVSDKITLPNNQTISVTGGPAFGIKGADLSTATVGALRLNGGSVAISPPPGTVSVMDQSPAAGIGTATYTESVTVSPGAKVLAVQVGAYGNTPNPAWWTITWNDLPMTLGASQLSANTTTVTSAIFYLNLSDITIPTTATLAGSFGGVSYSVVDFCTLGGVDTGAALVTGGADTVSGTTTQVTVDGIVAGSAAVTGQGLRAGSGTFPITTTATSGTAGNLPSGTSTNVHGAGGYVTGLAGGSTTFTGTLPDYTSNRHPMTVAVFTPSPTSVINMPTTAVEVAADSTLNLSGTTSATLGDLTLQLGAALSFANGASAAFNRLSGPSGSTVNASIPLEFSGGNMAGSIVGTGAITKTGSGTLVLSGTNGYGNTNVQAGVLEITSAGALPAGKSMTVGAGGTVVLSSGLSVGAGSGAANTSAAPVPEPGTVVLLLVGLAGLAIAGWRKRK